MLKTKSLFFIPVLAIVFSSFLIPFSNKGIWVYEKTKYKEGFKEENKAWNEKMLQMISYRFKTETSGDVIMGPIGKGKEMPFTLNKVNDGYELNGKGLTNQKMKFEEEKLIILQPQTGKVYYTKSK